MLIDMALVQSFIPSFPSGLAGGQLQSICQCIEHATCFIFVFLCLLFSLLGKAHTRARIVEGDAFVPICETLRTTKWETCKRKIVSNLGLTVLSTLDHGAMVGCVHANIQTELSSLSLLLPLRRGLPYKIPCMYKWMAIN